MKEKLPDGWEWKKLGDITDVFNGKTPSKQEQRDSGYPILKIKDIDENGAFVGTFDSFVNDEFFENHKLKCLKGGDTLILNAAHNSEYVGSKSCFISAFEDEVIPTGEWLISRSKSELLDNHFKHYLLTSPPFRVKIKSIVKGIHLYPKDVQKLLIPLPPLDVQQKIVSILEKAEETKRLRAQADELTQQFLKSVFLEMFGDPVRNPMGWEVRKLGELSTKILSGTTPKGGDQVYVKEGIIFFRSQNVWKNRIEFSDIAFIDEATHNKMKQSSLKNKDILVTKTGRINTENSSLGRAALFLGENDSANINGHVYLVRLQENNIHKFILFILTTNAYRDYIRSVCVGGIDKRQINKHHLEEFPIISPPLPLQQKFAAIVEHIEGIREQQAQSSQEISNLFDSLMQKAFTGELVS